MERERSGTLPALPEVGPVIQEDTMLEIITAVNKVLNDFIWGVPAMTCIIGVGLYLGIRTGFLQLRKVP